MMHKKDILNLQVLNIAHGPDDLNDPREAEMPVENLYPMGEVGTFKADDFDPEDFEFTQADQKISDTKFDTKPVSYFEDAFIRFRKNKASVVAAIIIGILVLYAIIVPFFSDFDVKFREKHYTKALPKSKFFSKFGIWDGSKKETLNQSQYDYYTGIGEETGIKPIKKLLEKRTTVTKRGRKKIETSYYEVNLDTYAAMGFVEKNLTEDQFNRLCKWQDATGIQVIYPAVDKKKFPAGSLSRDANYWYKINSKGEAKRNKKGEFVPLYIEDKPEKYTSLRVPFDDGKMSYYHKTQTGFQLRILYSNYYKYLYSDSKISPSPEVSPDDKFLVGKEASFLFGTNQYGQDIYTCLASGARFSFLLAIVISVINLSIGAVIGALEGYYGGTFDLLMERFKEVLAGVPFMITVTLFQLHLAKKVGPVVSLLFAFVLTGWVGMASLVRTQFYRFKHQEYVLSARTLGATDSRIIRKHIFPNAIGTIITSVVLIIPGVIFSESILSYLGIVNLQGTNTTSVGTLLAGGQAYLQSHPHIIFYPALFIALLEISFNLFGNGLRDAFNPSMRGADE